MMRIVKLILRYSFCPRIFLLFLALACLFWAAALAHGADVKETKRVLILFGNQSDVPAYPTVERGIKAGLAEGHEFHIEYYVEYLDYYRNPGQTHDRLLLDLFRRKFKDHKIDLVLAYSVPALSFAIHHAGDLFPGVPIIFSLVPESQLKKLALNPMVTGVLADIDYVGLLNTALKIQPGTRHVAIVNGSSMADLFFEKEIRKALAPYKKRLDLIYLTRLPMADVLERVRNLPKDSVVLYYVLSQDGTGKAFFPWETASMLAENANAPVYGCLDSYLGRGIVGGRMTSVEATGVRAGEIALRILRGEKPSNIPITSRGTIIDLFDWRQLKRFNIPESSLPPGSVVRYKRYSLWELYRGYIVAAFVLILLQSGLISFLLWQRAQRRRTQEQLTNRLRFEKMLAALSARFTNLPPERVDSHIGSVLESVGKLLQVDRVSVYKTSSEEQKLELVHSYEEAGVAPPLPEVHFKQVPWIMNKLGDNKVLVLPDLDDLPGSAKKDRAFLRSQGAVSLLLIPLFTGNATLGVLSLATHRRREVWPQELIRQCQLVAEVFSNAFVRKQHEESLTRAENKYRTVADFTYAWEYWSNLDGSLEYVSPSCERISGYTPREFTEDSALFSKIIVPEDRGVWDEHMHTSRHDQMPCEIQFRIQRRDGEIIWIEHNCQPVTDPQGLLQGFRASNRDITARKQVEEKIREREKDLRRLATQLISAHEEERRSLARELHDDLSQRLAALAIQAGRMEQQAVNEQAFDAEAYCRLKDEIIAISNDVHSLSRQLHPSILDDLGLKRAVESQCARFSSREGIELACTTENLPANLSKDVSLSIYRIIQEGLNNIAKHACARRAKVALRKTDGNLYLFIEDDGIGFDAAEMRKKPGLGLSSMHERVRIIHGVLRIVSRPDKGTTISVRVPLETLGGNQTASTDAA
jgi:PAS domain S-box-containing protein